MRSGDSPALVLPLSQTTVKKSPPGPASSPVPVSITPPITALLPLTFRQVMWPLKLATPVMLKLNVPLGFSPCGPLVPENENGIVGLPVAEDARTPVPDTWAFFGGCAAAPAGRALTRPTAPERASAASAPRYFLTTASLSLGFACRS